MKKLLLTLGLTLTLLLSTNTTVDAEETTTTSTTEVVEEQTTTEATDPVTTEPTETTDPVTEEPTETTDPVTEPTTDELPDAGVKPGELLYGVDKFFENIALKLTFSDEKRAEKLAKIAEERLAELNALDPELAAVYADELFNEYGLNLEKAQLYVQKLVAEGKISEEKLAKIEQRVAKAEARKDKISEKAKEKISKEIKDKVEETIKDAKNSIFSKFDNLDAIKVLHEEGYGYGQLLKLQAISQLSSKTIDELLLIEGVVVVNEENEKELNIVKLLETLSITEEQLRVQLNSYQDTAKESMQERIDQAKDRAVETREKIKDRVEERKGQEGRNNK